MVMTARASSFFHTAFVQSIVNAYSHGDIVWELIWSIFLNKFILNFILKPLIELGHQGFIIPSKPRYNFLELGYIFQCRTILAVKGQGVILHEEQWSIAVYMLA